MSLAFSFNGSSRQDEPVPQPMSFSFNDVSSRKRNDLKRRRPTTLEQRYAPGRTGQPTETPPALIIVDEEEDFMCDDTTQPPPLEDDVDDEDVVGDTLADGVDDEVPSFKRRRLEPALLDDELNAIMDSMDIDLEKSEARFRGPEDTTVLNAAGPTHIASDGSYIFEYPVMRVVLEERLFPGMDTEEALNKLYGSSGRPVIPAAVVLDGIEFAIRTNEEDEELDSILRFYTKMKIVQDGFLVDLLDLKQMRPILREYVANANLPGSVTGIGFVVEFGERSRRTDRLARKRLKEGANPVISTKTRLLSVDDAIEELITKMQENDREYDRSEPISIQLKTISLPGAFGSSGIGDELFSDKWVSVKYNTRTQCVMIAFILGRLKNQNLVILKGLNGKRSRQVPILAAGPKAWSDQMNQQKYSTGTLFKQYEAAGKKMPKGMFNNSDMKQLAQFLDIHVDVYDTRFELKRSFGVEKVEGPNTNVVSVILHQAHCELIVERSRLNEVELAELLKPEEYKPVTKLQEADGYNKMMAADIEAFSADKNLAWGIGSKLDRPYPGAKQEVFLYSTDCIERWFNYLDGLLPVWENAEWVRNNQTRAKKCVAKTKKGKFRNQELRRNESEIYVYFHNGGKYDFYLIREKLIQQGVLKLCIDGEMSNGSTMITFSAENSHGVKFVFRDSCRMLPQSLSALTEDLDVLHQKLSESVNFDDINEFFELHGFNDESIRKLLSDYPVHRYLQHDVYGLLEVIQKMALLALDQYGVNWTRCVTLSHFSKSIFRTRFLDDVIHNLTDKADKFISPAILGGDCGSHYLGQYKGRAWFYDVTSLYPFVCMTTRDQDGLLPARVLGEIVECEDVFISTLEDYARYFPSRGDEDQPLEYFMEMEVLSTNEAIATKSTFHMLPCKTRDGGERMMKPLLRKWTPLTRYSVEVRHGLKYGLYHYRVLRFLTFEVAPIYHKFMKNITDAKRDSKKAGLSALTLINKLVANSATGFIGMNVHGRQGVQIYSKDQMDQVILLALKGQLIDFQMLNDEYVSVHLESSIAKVFFSRNIYAAITAKGRIVKDEFERKVVANGGKVLYGDTDSVLVTMNCMEHPAFVDDFANPGEVGGWENELLCDEPGSANWYYDNIFLGGVKSYYLYNPALPESKTNPKVAQKGHNSHNGGPCQKDFEAYMVTCSLTEPKPSLQFRRGVAVAHQGFHLYTVSNSSKTFTLKYSKGFPTESGWIVPFDLYDTVQDPVNATPFSAASAPSRRMVTSKQLVWEAKQIVLQWIAHNKVGHFSLSAALNQLYYTPCLSASGAYVGPQDADDSWQQAVWALVYECYKKTCYRERHRHQEFFAQLGRSVCLPALPNPTQNELIGAVSELFPRANTIRNLFTDLQCRFNISGNEDFIRSVVHEMHGPLGDDEPRGHFRLPESMSERCASAPGPEDQAVPMDVDSPVKAQWSFPEM